jgi:hypothetical protein
MNRLSQLWSIGAICLLSWQAAHGGVLFSDSFESGTLASSGALTWTSSAGGVAVSTDWASTGRYSLKFPYVAKSSEEDDWVEQRFAVSSGTPELWIRFKLRIPNGYYHRDVPGSDNNKFLKLSSNAEANSSQGVNLTWEYWPDGAGGSMLHYHWSNPNVSIGSHLGGAFVFGPAEAGKVLEFVLRARMSTGPGISNGIVQTWVRSSDSEVFRQIHDERSAPMYPGNSWPTQTKWVAGYLMGWADSSFAQNSAFQLDDLIMSSTSLLDSASMAPRPPVSVAVQ